MLSKIQQATRQLAEMAKLKREIEAMETEGSAGGGIVRVRMNGSRMVRRVMIDPEVLKSGDAELLEELVKAAINDASRKVERDLANRFRAMGGGALGSLMGRR